VVSDTQSLSPWVSERWCCALVLELWVLALLRALRHTRETGSSRACRHCVLRLGVRPFIEQINNIPHQHACAAREVRTGPAITRPRRDGLSWWWPHGACTRSRASLTLRTPAVSQRAPLSRAMLLSHASCLFHALMPHTVVFCRSTPGECRFLSGSRLPDPLTAAHLSDGRSWSAMGASGEGPAALCLLLLLLVRTFGGSAREAVGRGRRCRHGRRVLLLVSRHRPASELLPRAASEL